MQVATPPGLRLPMDPQGLEILTVVWGIKHFKHYLAGAPFQLECDHQPLQQLIKQPDPTGIQARYIMHLQPYDIDLVIKPGKVHMNADALS